MRLFIVERIPLRDLARLGEGPRNGDVVAYFRALQDPDGRARKDFENRGITVPWAEDVLDHDDSDAIDAFHDSYLQNWYRAGEEDVSVADGISIAEVLNCQYSVNYRTGHIIRLGEICRRLLDSYGHGRTVVSDFRDGTTGFMDLCGQGTRLLRRAVLEHLVRTRGLSFRELVVERPVPSYGHDSNLVKRVNLVRQFFGGFRWPYLAARLRLRRQDRKRRKPRVYIFLNHGIHMVATALAKRGDIDVLIDRSDYPGTTPLRYDHMPALPPLAVVAGARRLRRHVARGWTKDFIATFCTFNGFDYSPLLRRTARHLLSNYLFLALIIVGQTLKLLRRYKPECVVVNGESTVQVRTIIAEAKKGKFKVIFFRHGYVTYAQRFHPLGHNNPHVIYLANGTDHVREYGTHLPASQKPRVEVMPNPATAMMNKVRGRWHPGGRRRVLALNFTAGYAQSVARTRLYDLYTLGLLQAAKTLTERGCDFTYRPHPGDSAAYIHYAVERMGLTGKVGIDTSPSFENALLCHDVVIVNLTSCHYQALFAGWPAIFFDPDFDRRHFIGLPGATDVDSPIATTAEELVDMVEAAFDPESTVARFPTEFVERYAERFIGKDAGKAHEIIADFLARETVGNHLGAWRRPRNDKGSTGPRQEAVRLEIAAR